MKKAILLFAALLLLAGVFPASASELAPCGGGLPAPGSEGSKLPVWGVYDFGPMHLMVQPEINGLITVEPAEKPEEDEFGILFTVSETASLEAGGYPGAGWLFSIGKVDGERLREMLCADMSGAVVFAKGRGDAYYMYYHPTDVRYARATVEEMQRDQEQWSMLCEWAWNVPGSLIAANLKLAPFRRGNTNLDIDIARAAYLADGSYTLSSTEFGPIEARGIDASDYADWLLGAGFVMTERSEAPSGEYMLLSCPAQDLRYEFFFGEGNLVREKNGDFVTWYEAPPSKSGVKAVSIVQGWYYALAENAGLRKPDTRLEPFLGTWAEKVAGRGMVILSRSLAPGKLDVEVIWPNSAFETANWSMTAMLTEDGKLRYQDGVLSLMSYAEGGGGTLTGENGGESGEFWLDETGALIWHDPRSERDEDSVFLHVG